MTPVWAQRQEALLHDCIVPPDVFDHMVERLRDFAVPYQAALETAAGRRNVSLHLQGLLSHLPRKNAEDEDVSQGHCQVVGDDMVTRQQ